LLQAQTAGFIDLELGQLEAARAKSIARNDFKFNIYAVACCLRVFPRKKAVAAAVLITSKVRGRQ